MAPRLTMKLPWLRIPGGTTGNLRPPSFVRYQSSSSVAGTQTGGGLSRQPGSSASSGPGSITAPERMWAPMVLDFSITQTEMSGSICLSRMANARPAGPAPTVTTSYSMTSRSGSGISMVTSGSAYGFMRAGPFGKVRIVAAVDARGKPGCPSGESARRRRRIHRAPVRLAGRQGPAGDVASESLERAGIGLGHAGHAGVRGAFGEGEGARADDALLARVQQLGVD